MTEDEIRPILNQLLRKVAPETEPEKLKPDDNIQQTLAMDSFDYLQFIVGMDEEFGIQTPEDDYGKIATLRDLLDYVMKMKK